LIGDDIATRGTLLMVPFTQGTPFGEEPYHSKGMKEFFALRRAAIIATVESHFPKDVGRIKVHPQAILLFQLPC
jgi:hypothetical protein